VKGVDLKEYVMRFNNEIVLILDLQVAYSAFLDRLLSRRFKFSLAESKVTTLENPLRSAQDFIQATRICTRDDFVHQETQKKWEKEIAPKLISVRRKMKRRMGIFTPTPKTFS